MAKPTIHELGIIKQVKERISDLELDDEYLSSKNLVRFVRARNGQLDLTERMIRMNVLYYQNHDVEEIMRWEDPAFFSDFPWSFLGFDEVGGPVIHLPMGRWKPEAVTDRRDEYIRMGIQYFETVWAAMKFQAKDKDAIPQFSILIDLEGLGWRSMTYADAVQGSLHMVKIFEANYPDTLKVAIIVNAPSVFSMMWKLVKPFVSEVTHAKLQFVGSFSEETASKTINRFIAKEKLPEKYGGLLPDNTKMTLQEIGAYEYVFRNGNAPQKVAI